MNTESAAGKPAAPCRTETVTRDDIQAMADWLKNKTL